MMGHVFIQLSLLCFLVAPVRSMRKQDLTSDLRCSVEASMGISGVPLFYTEVNSRFAAVKKLLDADETSLLSRLKSAFKTEGSKTVLVGAGGSGKTETILRALDDTKMSKDSFDLREWYVHGTGIDKADYDQGYDASGYSKVKADQLKQLHANASAIQRKLTQMSGKLLFLDEIDIGNGEINSDEIEAMKLLLKWGDEFAPTMSKVVVIHLLVSTQADVLKALKDAGYPQPGSPFWIDFQDPYPEDVEKQILLAALENCEGDNSTRLSVIENVMQYIKGLPPAYMPLLINKKGALTDLDAGLTCEDAGAKVMSAAKAKLGGKLLEINVGLRTTDAAKAVIASTIRNPSADAREGAEALAVDGAVASMAIIRPDGGKPVMPPVMREAFKSFHARVGEACAEIIGRDLCDAISSDSDSTAALQ